MMYEQLWKIVGLRVRPEDHLIPNGERHFMYLYRGLGEYVAISVSGDQWDLLYWIYRLSDTDKTFKDWSDDWVENLI